VLLRGCGVDGLSLLHGLAIDSFRGNQLISGVAIKLLAAGPDRSDRAKTGFQQGGRTPSLIGGARFSPKNHPPCSLTTLLRHPIIGPLSTPSYLGSHRSLFYMAFLADGLRRGGCSKPLTRFGCACRGG